MHIIITVDTGRRQITGYAPLYRSVNKLPMIQITHYPLHYDKHYYSFSHLRPLLYHLYFSTFSISPMFYPFFLSSFYTSFTHRRCLSLQFLRTSPLSLLYPQCPRCSPYSIYHVSKHIHPSFWYTKTQNMILYCLSSRKTYRINCTHANTQTKDMCDTKGPAWKSLDEKLICMHKNLTIRGSPACLHRLWSSFFWLCVNENINP